MIRKIILIIVVIGVVLFVLAQLVPYGRNHTNPPVVQEIQWDSPETLALARRACYDCHSNETVWPWYSNVAPASWLLAADTTDARNSMNFSEWGSRSQPAQVNVRQIEEGRMPPSRYTALHPESRLTAAEKAQLVAGIQASMP